MKAVGIDFGTTNSVVASWSPNGVEVLDLDVDNLAGEWGELGFNRIMPSVFAYEESGNTKFGWAAKRHPGNRFEAIKRLFATQQEHATDGAGDAFAVEELATMLFAEMKRAALVAGLDAQQAVITVPANSRGQARHRTKVCAGMGGFEVLMLLNEPTAAAMAYAAQSPGDQQILVFDWGGGTLDVTILQAVDGVFLEKASKGLPTTGGIDFDTRFARTITETIPDYRDWDPLSRHSFNERLELAKIRLSTAQETQLLLPGGETRRLTRSMFENAVRPLIEQSRDPIERCLQDLGVGPDSIDAVVMVGGTSNIPAVRSLVAEIAQQEPVSSIDPMTAVGEGAAIAAAILAEELQDNDFVVSTEHALGLIVQDRATNRLMFEVLIPRNMMLPASSRRDMYEPVDPYADSLDLQVIEGDPKQQLGHPDHVVLETLAMPVPGVPGAQDRYFDVTFRYDRNGILHIEATDSKTDAQLLEREISFGVSTDRRELVRISGRAREAVETGRVDRTSSQPSANLDTEAVDLLQKAHVKVLPFLEDDEAAGLRGLVAKLERAENEAAADAKRDLRAALAPYSYLF
jgi:molecular chaperone DnaK